jgi:hypothetical protein
VESHVLFHLGYDPALPSKSRLEVTDGVKHSSLLWQGVNYLSKKFYEIGLTSAIFNCLS